MEVVYFILWLVCFFGLIVYPFIKAISRVSNFFSGENKRKTSPDTVLEQLIINAETNKKRNPIDYAEVLFLGVSPIAGSIFIYVFQDSILPFAIPHALTLLVYTAIPYFSYWGSRLFKDQIANWLLYACYAGMIMGVVLYTAMSLHFISQMTLAGIGILPIFGFTLLAPVPAIGFSLEELTRLHHYLDDLLISRLEFNDAIQRVVKTVSSKRKGLILFFSGMVVLQLLLILSGQKWNALFLAFLESENFFFSTQSYGGLFF